MTKPLLVVADLGRAHGLRGEVVARLHGLGPEELLRIAHVVLRRPDGRESVVHVKGARAQGGGVVLAVAEIGDRTAAEDARGGELLVRREDLPELGAREWYLADLVGCEVVEENGRTLGTLEEVLQLPAHDVYVVRGSCGEVLLPATDEVILAVDRDARRMTVHLIPGLAPEEDETSGEKGPNR